MKTARRREFVYFDAMFGPAVVDPAEVVAVKYERNDKWTCIHFKEDIHVAVKMPFKQVLKKLGIEAV